MDGKELIAQREEEYERVTMLLGMLLHQSQEEGEERGRRREKTFSKVLGPFVEFVSIRHTSPSPSSSPSKGGGAEEGVEEGKVVFDLRVGQEICNMNGFLHGGAAATAVDVLSTVALVALCPSRAPTGGVSASINMEYHGAAKKDSVVRVVCSVRKAGSRLAFLSVHGFDRSTGASKFVGAHIKFVGQLDSLRSKL